MSDEKEENQTPILRPNTIIDTKIPESDNEPKVGPPVDVDGDITPITRKPILSVRADQWQKMSVMQLHQQLEALEERYLFAQQVGHIEIMNQVNRGILELRALIHKKTPDELKLI